MKAYPGTVLMSAHLLRSSPKQVLTFDTNGFLNGCTSSNGSDWSYLRLRCRNSLHHTEEDSEHAEKQLQKEEKQPAKRRKTAAKRRKTAEQKFRIFQKHCFQCKEKSCEEIRGLDQIILHDNENNINNDWQVLNREKNAPRLCLRGLNVVVNVLGSQIRI